MKSKRFLSGQILHEESQKKGRLAAAKLENKSGHARQSVGEKIFAGAGETGFEKGNELKRAAAE
jgi:hypothetical protein